MTNCASVSSSILSSMNGAMVRRGDTNFIAIPAEVVDGVQTYVGVKVTALKSADTERKDGTVIPAFDFDSAKLAYDAWKTQFDAKASAPKKSKGADPAVEARKVARAEWMRNWIDNVMDATKEYTASDVYAEADKQLFPTPMMVGSALIAMDGNGIVIHDNGKGNKKTYTKA